MNLTSLFFKAMTPASVKVVISIFSGSTQAFKIILAVLKEIICVFPVPGPATTIIGPSKLSTASNCSGLSMS